MRTTGESSAGSPAMDKSSVGSLGSWSGILPSSGLPYYQTSPGEPYQKYWRSERVPLSTYSKRRMSGSEIVILDNGRTLPSKWVDAEKWICSPVSGDGVGRQLMPLYYVRTQKSKSGPLIPITGNRGVSTGTSPAAQCYDYRRRRKSLTCSPLQDEAFVPEQEDYEDDEEQSVMVATEVYDERDEELIGNNEDCSTASSLPSRDTATQSVERSTSSSMIEAISMSANASLAPATAVLESQFSKFEVRDVQVDNQVTITRWSKKHTSRCSDKSSMKIVEWKKTTDTDGCLHELSQTKSVSKILSEEAKITAWENLQKNKAEAAIRKLEMKLEKKRSSSMDKIMKKLRTAQKKAEEMRNEVDVQQANQFMITLKKKSYSYRKTSHMSGCFACPSF